MKDKKVLIGIAIVVLLLLGGGMYFMIKGKSVQNQEPQQQQIEEEVIKLNPEDIDLTLEFNGSTSQPRVKFKIGKAGDIRMITFDGVYEDKEGIGQNLYDEIEIEEGVEEYESKFYDLGTCSSGTCRYHQGVEKVDFIFNIQKTDGKAYEVTETLEF